MREQRFINIYKQFDISLTSKHVINEINQNLICDGLEIKEDQEKGERLREARGRGREGRKERRKEGRREGGKRGGKKEEREEGGREEGGREGRQEGGKEEGKREGASISSPTAD